MKGEDAGQRKSSDGAPNSCESTTAMSQTTVGQNQDGTQSSVTTQEQGFTIFVLTVLAGVSTTSLGVLAILWLPLPVLMALAMFVTSFTAMISLCVLLVTREFRAIIRGRGIGGYLPRSLYTRLTQLTLHEWMQDTSLTLEYRHLALYFVPGITAEQLETYVDSLAPRHRQNLRRHGLGHVFGETFMRIIMGDERYRQHMRENQPRPTELLLPPPSALSANVDAGSDIGSVTPDPLTIESPRALSIEPIVEESEEAVASRTITIQSDSPDDLESEGNVLNDAITSMMNTYMNVSTTAVTSSFVRVIDSVTPYFVGTGFGITTIAAGLGLFGTWSTESNSNRALAVRIPSTQVLWVSGFIGGLTAGGMLAIRSGVRMFFREARQQNFYQQKKKEE